MRLMPCMYFTNLVLGRLASGFLMYKYSAICFSTLIKKLHRKDTVLISGNFLKLWCRTAAQLVLFFYYASS